VKILIIEGDDGVAQPIIDALADAGHCAQHVVDGKTGLALARSSHVDVIILDRILDGGADGLEVLAALRQERDFTPILLISGRGNVCDKVEGLRAGANDYLTKPLALEELVARVEALVLPRKERSVPTLLVAGDVQIDLLSRAVTRAGRNVDLQPREFKLLEFMMRHVGQVVTRKQLLEAIWKTRFDPGTSVIEVHLSRLRKKIDTPFGHPVLHTVRNIGFVFRPVNQDNSGERRAQLNVPALRADDPPGVEMHGVRSPIT
jgi:two-component system OmpR family response regulator